MSKGLDLGGDRDTAGNWINYRKGDRVWVQNVSRYGTVVERVDHLVTLQLDGYAWVSRLPVEALELYRQAPRYTFGPQDLVKVGVDRSDSADAFAFAVAGLRGKGDCLTGTLATERDKAAFDRGYAQGKAHAEHERELEVTAAYQRGQKQGYIEGETRGHAEGLRTGRAAERERIRGHLDQWPNLRNKLGGI